jgi:hypothetical protein
MIFISNPFALPLLVLIWSADLWLWLSVIKMIAEKIKPANTFSRSVAPVTDWLPEYLNRYLKVYLNKPLPQRTVQIISITGVFLARCMLVFLITAF